MNICDAIEQFLLDAFSEDGVVLISRNNLAQHFDCAPSQINYVLTTRFTADTGYLTASRRGGGGYIEIRKIDVSKDGYLNEILCREIGEEISCRRAQSILETLAERNVVTRRESALLNLAMSDSSLSSPIVIKDRLRAQILKNIILELIQERQD